MAPINSIFIPYVSNHWTPELIASTLYENGIAKTSSIKIYKNIILESSVNSVEVKILEWMDTELAYNLIVELLKGDGYGTIYLSDEEFWKIYTTPNNIELLFNDRPNITSFSLTFYDQLDYMIGELIEDDLNMDEIEDELKVNGYYSEEDISSNQNQDYLYEQIGNHLCFV